MKLYCRLLPRTDQIRDSLVARLKALGHEPIIDSDGAVVLDWEGECSGTPLAIITVFESFGCDRVFVFKDWKGEDDGRPRTKIRANLGN